MVSLVVRVDSEIPVMNSLGIHHRPFRIEHNDVLIRSPIGLEIVDLFGAMPAPCIDSWRDLLVGLEIP